MEKSLLVLVPACFLMLASCVNIGDFDFGDDEEDESYHEGGDQDEFVEPSIESLVKKYSGFEVAYRSEDTVYTVGGSGNTYWYYSTSVGGETPEIDSATITTVNGSSYINQSYSSGDLFSLTDTENNMAALIADSNYIGYMQHGGILVDMKYTKVTIKGEAARKYDVIVGSTSVYVNEKDGYTMQIDYSDEYYSILFNGVKKGSEVKAPSIEDQYPED